MGDIPANLQLASEGGEEVAGGDFAQGVVFEFFFRFCTGVPTQPLCY